MFAPFPATLLRSVFRLISLGFYFGIGFLRPLWFLLNFPPIQLPTLVSRLGGLAPIGTLLSHQLWGDARLSPQSLFLMNQTVKERSDPSFFAREV